MMFGAAILAACAAPQRWTHPSLPSDQWSVDQATCKTRANRLIDRELTGADRRAGGARGALERDIQKYDATRRRDSYFADCLQGKGYVKDSAKGRDA